MRNARAKITTNLCVALYDSQEIRFISITQFAPHITPLRYVLSLFIDEENEAWRSWFSMKSGYTLFCGLPGSILPFVTVSCVSFRSSTLHLSNSDWITISTWHIRSLSVKLGTSIQTFVQAIKMEELLKPMGMSLKSVATTISNIILYIKFKPVEENSALPMESRNGSKK